VIPSNSKWYRNLVIARILVGTLEALEMRYPEPDFDPAAVRMDLAEAWKAPGVWRAWPGGSARPGQPPRSFQRSP
jgi:hypothetical protein